MSDQFREGRRFDNQGDQYIELASKLAGERNEDSTTGSDHIATAEEGAMSDAIDLSNNASTVVYNGPALLLGIWVEVTIGTAAATIDDDNTMTYTRLRSLRVDKSSSTDGVADAELGTGSEIVAALATAGEVYAEPSSNDYTPANGTLSGFGQVYQFGYDGSLLKNPPAIGPVEYRSGEREAANHAPASSRDAAPSRVPR